jgi:uncharacterized protein YhaN
MTLSGWIRENGDWLSVVVVLAALAVFMFGYLSAANQRKIDGIRAEQIAAIQKTAELEKLIAVKDADIKHLVEAERELRADLERAQQVEADALGRVNELERQKDQAVVDVFSVRTDDGSLAEFRSTFPVMSRAAGFGVIDLQHGRIVNPYLVIPLHMAAELVIYKKQLDLADEQLTEYGGITKARGVIDGLHDQLSGKTKEIAALQAEKFTACDAVRQEMTETLIERQSAHIKDLERPRIAIPSGVTLGLGVIAGGAAGWFLKGQNCGVDIINLGGQF